METPVSARVRVSPVPSSSAPDDPTIEPRRDVLSSLELTTIGQPGERQFARFDIGLVHGSASPQSLEIQALLRQRLRNLVLIALGANAYFNVFRFLRSEFTPTYISWTMVPAAVYLAGLTAVLWWNPRRYSLAQLRWLEGLLFGASTVYFTGETYTPLFVDPGWLLAYAQRHAAEMSILARQPSMFWMTVIVTYGTFIPNTGRRCAAVAGLMALSPVTVVAVAGLLSEIVPARLLIIFLSEMVLWLGVSVAIAIYGSHKITALREEALAARKLGQYQLKRRLGGGGMARSTWPNTCC